MPDKKGTLTIRIVGDTKPLEKDLDDGLGRTERKMKVFADRAGPVLQAGMIGAGTVAGAALGSALMEGLDREAVVGRLQASLGLTDEEAKRYGKAAGDLYKAGFGESFEDVAGAVESVASTIGDELDPDQLEPITEKALNLASAFELDVGEAVSAVGYLIRTGLARDATEAFDLITVALQRIPREMRGEALEALSEYGGAFAALGFDGEEAIRLILDAADETSVGIDKVGDAIKEFLIRSTDGSTATLAAFETLGINAGEISNQILAGGDTAEAAFDRIVQGLLGLEDPSLRAQTAVALFGTPIEDLNVNKIPAFLTALEGAKGGLDGVSGAADGVGDSMTTNATKVEAFKRTVEDSVVNFLAETVIPALQDFDENWDLTWRLVAAETSEAAQTIIGYLGNVRDAFQGPIDGALDLLGLLSEISGVDVGDVAKAVGMKESDLEFLAPEEWERRKRIAPPSNVGSDFVPGSRMPIRHTGGPAQAGRMYLTGGKGREELFVPHADGQVLSPAKTRDALTPSGNVYYNNFQINEAQDLDAQAIAHHLASFLARP